MGGWLRSSSTGFLGNRSPGALDLGGKFPVASSWDALPLMHLSASDMNVKGVLFSVLCAAVKALIHLAKFFTNGVEIVIGCQHE